MTDGVEITVTWSAVERMVVTVETPVLTEGETSWTGGWVVTDVEVVVMVVIIVVGASDSVTIVVESRVSVTGGIVLGCSVIVCVESLVTICVVGWVTPSGWPPSTGTTE